MLGRTIASVMGAATVLVAVGCSLINAPAEVIAGGTGGEGGEGATGPVSSSHGSGSGSSSSSSGTGGSMANCGNGKLDPGEACDPQATCPTSCDDQDACTTDSLMGSAAACTAACTHTTITTCSATKDGCCPAGCDGNQDPDCIKCGNGKVEPGETCDGNCPTSCNDGMACTNDVLTGAAATCNAVCKSTPIAVCVSGDGCCPAGCAAPTDTDCCKNPGGGSLSAENGLNQAEYYCYNAADGADVRALKACESHFGVGTCCVITGGYQDQQYGQCGADGNAGSIHWHWDNHPDGHCAPNYVIGDVLSPGWCGSLLGNFLD